MTVREIETEVLSVDREADGVLSLRLGPTGADALPPWEPGAHVDLLLGGDLERQYSLCGAPEARDAWRIAVLREPESRGGSAFVHTSVAAGDRLTVRGPRNHFNLVEADAYRFVAGGIGITPILPMLARLSAEGRPWRLLYGGRRRGSMAFVDELAALGGDVVLWPQDEHGLLDLDAFLGPPADGTAIYCCGPEGLLAAVEARAERWPAGALHLERFAPKDGALEGAATAFEVVLQESGITIAVGPDETIADAIEAAGVDVDTSCREGTCGTCETAVLEGVPDHRDSVLSASEQASGEVMMICCSRARTPRLVLDL
ncbi:MAG TPA: PDR/VanB family oxidoreductase [Baekduia sp.]|uniref:PDR/VanB family oxidoreductase n=1 Tax=Baekduia sp. TaxID=2600305 RepID=UPI002D77AA9F|nr:PDR/VanB family oxidoreductase [Baekduia sp.]HET6509945.1 PDR/VanB family oxidoreductase [Baekduia sp.]